MRRASLSIALCSYNGATFLPSQLDSLLAQSRLPDQIVISDDVSTDGSWGILQTFAAQARACGIEVVLHRQELNLGFVANFSWALARAEGDLVFLCDQDDVWYPDKLAVMADEMERNQQLMLLHSNARRVDAEGEVLQDDLLQALRLEARELEAVRQGDAFRVYLRRNLATGAATVLRRSVLQRSLPVPEGWVHDEWLAVCASALGRVAIWPEPLLDYRQHSGNQLGMRPRRWRDMGRDLFRNSDLDLSRRLLRLAALETWLRQEAVVADTATQGMLWLQDLHRHLLARQALPVSRWRRCSPALAEWRRRGYQVHATGWRTLLHDVLRDKDRGGCGD